MVGFQCGARLDVRAISSAHANGGALTTASWMRPPSWSFLSDPPRVMVRISTEHDDLNHRSAQENRGPGPGERLANCTVDRSCGSCCRRSPAASPTDLHDQAAQVDSLIAGSTSAAADGLLPRDRMRRVLASRDRRPQPHRRLHYGLGEDRLLAWMGRDARGRVGASHPCAGHVRKAPLHFAADAPGLEGRHCILFYRQFVVAEFLPQ